MIWTLIYQGCWFDNGVQLTYWVRQVMQCEKLRFVSYAEPHHPVPLPVKQINDISQFVIQLAHLLGGTETMRYPGALIENQMGIDLILSGKLDWKEMLDRENPQGRFLPMTFEDATHVGRALMRNYGNHLPYPYDYPGKEENIYSNKTKSFVEAEQRLTSSWLDMVKERDGHNEHPPLPKAIRGAIPGWYPGM